ncbi:MAG: type IV secretion system DNA-binding domain-containing protein, partial [Bacteroidia bacterium]|nr:type IV secretion system DNA-binding domain-containing protein [Bacteroidia bacterium]
MVNLPPEKLGSFYLGARYDSETKEITSESVNYDARDLTTHAVCVGMTGSGKTGLCIGLLEEAAIDQVPAIIIDPKGDMTNLLLQFDGLDDADFKKWINADDAGRKGMSVDDYAKSTAEKWKNGLASWGQGDERMQKLKNSVDYTIYTPKSDSGVPVNILGSFAAPGIDFDSDAEMLRERIQGTVAALLGMIGSKEDPSRSREGILLSTLFEHYWKNNEDLDLASLIKGIQKPPFQQLGVFDIDTFFPEKDRFEMAMAFNTLVASPQFAYWLMGDPLDIDKMYFTAEGKPRHSIFYIAHLSESERMF